MQEVRRVRVIKANTFGNVKTPSVKSNRLRVAAYARVSTDHEEQEDSFERQVSYYTSFIQANPNWEFVKVYSDPGISGTKAEKRPGFQEMIEACRNGQIDKIMVKSIARFARNTVDALKYIRELKDLGISVFFESQNLDTLTPGGDILLTLLAATAEEESRTISKNVRWAFQKKFERGEVTFNHKQTLGFDKDKDGNYIIVEEEAKIVRRIYREFLVGKAVNAIARELNDEGVLTKCGGTWCYGTIRNILKNEKYYGAAIMGKTFKPDVLSPRRIKNTGQQDMFYAENVLPPIVSKETFDAVQHELQLRSEDLKSGNLTYGKSTTKYAFSKVIKCGCCGSYYGRCNNIRVDKKKVASWWCSNRRIDDESCPQKGITEKGIEDAFVSIINDICGDVEAIKASLVPIIDSIVDNNPKDDMRALEEEVANLQSEMFTLHKKKTSGEISTNEYMKKGKPIADKIEELRKKMDELEGSYASSELHALKMKDVVNALDELKPTTEFDETMFRRLVDTIVVNERYKLTFNFKCGISKVVTIDK